MTENKVIYIGHLLIHTQEGGMARNHAFYLHACKSGYEIHNLYNQNIFKRLYNVVKFAVHSLTWRKRTIFIHLGTLFLVFPKQLLEYSFFFRLFSFWYYYVSKNNKLFIEINDLPYEQALDLGLTLNKFLPEFQKVVFAETLKNSYVFAASKMRDYVVDQYNINKARTQVIINGAPMQNLPGCKNDFKKYDASKIKFVYAGTLNKGRGIEELLSIFEDTRHYLFLLGEQGDWIPVTSNIIYLGSYSETDALALVSQCDIGVVHYAEEKLYYNICYPTKYSFYIAAGLPILSTNLTEAKAQLAQYDFTYFRSLTDWPEFISTLQKEQLDSKKVIVAKVKALFSWEAISQKLRL